MNIVMSGATGFIGRHLLSGLLETGHRCRCLVRNSRTFSRSELGRRVELVEGDVMRPTSVRGIGQDVDVAFHLAGAGHVASVSSETSHAALATNIEGTRNVAEACGRDGVRRFVHFSSTAAMGLVRRPQIDETVPCQPETPYQKSKYESESAACEQAERFGMELLILRPCMVYGPGGMGEFLKFCRLIQKGLFPRIGLGRNLTPIVHVADVVQAALRALDSGKPGHMYLIASERSYPMAELHKTICEAMDVRRPYVYVPRSIALTAALLLEKMASLREREPVVSRKNIISTSTGREFDIRKAKRELGYAPDVDLRFGVKETVGWYRSEGLLPPSRRLKAKGRPSAGNGLRKF